MSGTEKRPTIIRQRRSSAEQIQEDLRTALAEFEESKARPYYDAKADRADAERYDHGTTVDEFTKLVKVRLLPSGG